MMNGMERPIATVSVDGQFVLPPNVQSELRLEPGSIWEVSVDDSSVILHPVSDGKPEATLPESLLALRGMFADGASLEDDLMEWRRSDKW
jgi:bifunctional DNA-binding transcriptional regulator/antitoxin component of YhaV-PrlF toxin-antitoxin module